MASSRSELTPPSQQLTHKLHVLCYDGTADPVVWLYKAEQFFGPHNMLEEENVWIASFMEGVVQDWQYRLQQNHTTHT